MIGKKTEHASHTCKNTIDHQTVNGTRLHLPLSVPDPHIRRQLINPNFQNLLKPRTDHIKRQIENKHHDPDKTWNRRIFSGKYTVNLLDFASVPCSAFGFTTVRSHKRLNKVKTHICDGGTPV